MKRSVIYDIISFVLLLVGLAGLLLGGWYGLHENWKLACFMSIVGLLTIRLSHRFVRTAIALSGKSHT